LAIWPAFFEQLAELGVGARLLLEEGSACREHGFQIEIFQTTTVGTVQHAPFDDGLDDRPKGKAIARGD